MDGCGGGRGSPRRARTLTAGFVRRCGAEVRALAYGGARLTCLCDDDAARAVSLGGALLGAARRPGAGWRAALSGGALLAPLGDAALWVLRLDSGACLSALHPPPAAPGAPPHLFPVLTGHAASLTPY
jgi:hypothetical protein